MQVLKDESIVLIDKYVDCGHIVTHVLEYKYLYCVLISHEIQFDVVTLQVLHCVSHLHPRLFTVSLTVPVGHLFVQFL